MLSQKQLEANRQNAKLGGVKTEGGKTVSKYNALKHGLLVQEVAIASEDKARLQELLDGLRASLQPQGELEDILTDRIVANLWRLKRCMQVENGIIEYNRNDMRVDLISSEGQRERGIIADMLDSVQIDRILRYETAIERGIFRALHELQRIQAQRRGEVVNSPVAVDIEVSQKD
jgi:hypothetical protein